VGRLGLATACEGAGPMHLGWGFVHILFTLWKGKARTIFLALRDLGILTGYEDGTFRPDQPITRIEAASLIYHTLAFLGKLPPLE